MPGKEEVSGDSRLAGKKSVQSRVVSNSAGGPPLPELSAQAVLATITDGIVVLSREGRFLFANDAAEAMLGFPLGSLLGRDHWELFPSTVGTPLEKMYRRVAAGGAPEELEYFSDRRGRWFHVKAHPSKHGVTICFSDVTREKAQRAGLELAEERFRLAASHRLITLYEQDRDLRYTWLYPLHPEHQHAIGRTDEELGMAGSTRELADLKRRVMKTGLELRKEFKVVLADGIHYYDLFISPRKNVGGEIVGVAGTALDITEKKRSEEARAWLAAVVENSEDAIISKTLGGIVTTWNRGAEKMFGYTAAEIVGRSIMLLIPSDRVAEEAEIIARLKRRESIEHFETIRQRKDGARIAVSLSVSPVLDGEGNVVGASKIARDITVRQQTEAALRSEYEITEHLNHIARSLATELDLEKIVQLITDVGTQITRAKFGAFFYNKVDANGESYMLYSLSGVPREAFAKFPMPRATAIFGPTFRGEGVIRLDDVRKDPRFGHNAPYHGMPAGHLPVVSYLAVPVFARSGEVLGGLFFGHPEPGVFTARDEKIVVAVAAQAAAAMNTARVYQAEQRARDAAERANKAKDHFLSALSHELRTPLTPVLAILSGLTEDTEVPPRLAQDLETIRRNILLETRLIDDLLDLTRISSGKLELHREMTSLGQVVESAIETCADELARKRLVLERDFGASDRKIFVDRVRVTQVVWNLIKNAIKFTDAGGRITVRTRETPGEPGASVIEVQDTGIGIEPDQLVRIFDAFAQGGRQITRQFGGLGLGLAIGRAIVEAHEGTIRAASEGKGKGSTFTLTLPWVTPTPIQSPTPPAAASGGRPGVVRRRILLVEDHADSAKVLAGLLRRDGHEVRHASTVAEALAFADEEMAAGKLDLVVSDVGLPDGNGYEMMRQLSGKHGLPGIALSGFGMESDRAESTAAGFSFHLTKPVTIAALRQAIAAMPQRG